MAERRAEDDGPSGAPQWIVTFTDMISLLLTFFILLLTFSSMEEEKFSQASGSLAGAFGVLTQRQHSSHRDLDPTLSMKKQATDPNGALTPSMQEQTIDAAVDQVQNRSQFNVRIDATDIAEGKRLRLTPDNGDETFRLGTADLTDTVHEALGEMGRLFGGIGCRLVIEVHVDDLTWSAADVDSPLELTARMGHAVAAVFEKEGIAPERIGVSPMGASRPLQPNDTARHRKHNRRLEILILPNNRDPLLAAQRGGGRR